MPLCLSQKLILKSNQEVPIALELYNSCSLGAGQFCTNPGLVIVPESSQAEVFLHEVSKKFAENQGGTLLGSGVSQSLIQAIKIWQQHGAQMVTGGEEKKGPGYSFANTLLRVSGDSFLANPEALQTEAFGTVSLMVFARDNAQMISIAAALEGNLTGCIYSHTGGEDDTGYNQLAPVLRAKVGRLLNDKMPTGVAVSPAMNHGGPYPATGHPGFTAVGIPASLLRFAALRCYDNVRAHRLPPELQNQNPTGRMWRLIDREWTQRDV